MSTIWELHRLTASKRIAIENHAGSASCYEASIARKRAKLVKLMADIDAEVQQQQTVLRMLNRAMLDTIYDVDDVVNVRGDLYKVGEPGATATYLGPCPDADEEEIADELPERRAEYAAAVAFNDR